LLKSLWLKRKPLPLKPSVQQGIQNVTDLYPKGVNR
jgi:hypothetical protein